MSVRDLPRENLLQTRTSSGPPLDNESGQEVTRYDFWPFGQVSGSPSVQDSRMFGGTEHDGESGLDYLGARSYAGMFGRFTTPDDSSYMDPANPQSLNRYVYVDNNPIRYTDPTGHEPPCPPPTDTSTCVEGHAPDVGLLQFLVNSLLGPLDKAAQGAVQPSTLIPRSQPLHCQPDIIGSMNTIWRRSQNGESGIEASFNVNGSPTDYQVRINATTNELMQQGITIQSNTFAVFHVHPNRGGQTAWQPSAPDMKTAGATRRPLQWYIVSREGLGFYDAATKEPPTRWRPGLEWGTSCK